jgi:uncharacterized protein
MFILIILLIILLIDVVFFVGISRWVERTSKSRKIKMAYWSFTAFVSLFLLSALIVPPAVWPKIVRVYLLSFLFTVSIAKFFGSIAILMAGIVIAIKKLVKIIKELFIPDKDIVTLQGKKISRSNFIGKLAVLTASVPFAFMIYGKVKGAFDYTVHHNRLIIPHLPEAFNGLKIIQVSDIHAGSFLSSSPLEKAIEIIISHKPDIIFFTGDLVNDVQDEARGFIDTLKKITAPLGTVSILGNHDYGDYVQWPNKEDKENHFQQMLKLHKDLGWTLLRNQNLVLKRDNASLAIIGTENWSRSERFPRYADLNLAMQGTEEADVKLLLTHDPTHWQGEVLNHENIDVTFSGHTHGMQFGVEIPGIKWSPVQYVYPEWAGLYQKGEQYLYVNRGLGFIGYAGRIGIMPEITVHELFNKG